MNDCSLWATHLRKFSRIFAYISRIYVWFFLCTNNRIAGFRVYTKIFANIRESHFQRKSALPHYREYSQNYEKLRESQHSVVPIRGKPYVYSRIYAIIRENGPQRVSGTVHTYIHRRRCTDIVS